MKSRQIFLEPSRLERERMFQMMGVFAEFERSMIQERVRAGLRRAKMRASSSVARGYQPSLKGESSPF
jgi:DNA invertase Pin-like site-specific DNA recombinase